MTNRSIWHSAVTVGLRGGTATMGTFALNSATRWAAYGFQPSKSATISKIRIYCSAATGVLIANDLQMGINQQTSGTIGTELSHTTTVTALPTGAAYVEFTGLTQAVVFGNQYYALLKNLNATPTAIFPTISYAPSSAGDGIVNGVITPWGNGIITTTDGSAWTNTVAGSIPNIRIEYSDGSFDGFNYSASNVDTVNAVFSKTEVGVLFTTPNNAFLNLAGYSAITSKGGTPTGSIFYKLYKQGVYVAKTNTMPVANMLSNVNYPLWFQDTSGTPVPTIQTLDPNTDYIISLAETTQTDLTTNSYRQTVLTVANDAATKALLPLAKWQQAYTLDGSTTTPTWVYTDTKAPYGALLLDTGTPLLTGTIGYPSGSAA